MLPGGGLGKGKGAGPYKGTPFPGAEPGIRLAG